MPDAPQQREHTHGICDEEGLLNIVDGPFARVLQQEWPDGNGSTLPISISNMLSKKDNCKNDSERPLMEFE